MKSNELAAADTTATAQREKAVSELKTEWGQAYDQKLQHPTPFYLLFWREDADSCIMRQGMFSSVTPFCPCFYFLRQCTVFKNLAPFRLHITSLAPK